MLARMRIISVVLIGILMITAGGCDLLTGDTGGVELRFARRARSIQIEPTDTEIVLYEITLTHQESSATIIREHAVADGTGYVIDALQPGVWSLTIAAKNSLDETVGQIEGGSELISVRRGSVSSVHPVIVPLSGEGTLRFSVSLSQEVGLLDSPIVKFTVTGMDAQQISSQESFAFRPADYTYDEIRNFEFQLPSGWYQARIELFDTDSKGSYVKRDHRTFFPRVLSGMNTSVPAAFTIEDYAVGDIGPAGGTVFYTFNDTTSLTNVVSGQPAVNQGAILATVDGQSGYKFNGDTSYIETEQTFNAVPDVFEASIFVPSDIDDGQRVGIIAGNYSRSGEGNDNTLGWEIHQYGRPRIYWDGGHPDIKYDYDVRKDRWIHLRWERTDTGIDLYVDGEPVDVYSTSMAGPGVDTNLNEVSGGRVLILGSDHFTEYDTHYTFTGLISDVKIFGADDRLVAHYPMKRYLEAAPEDLGTAAGDMTFPFGYYRSGDTDIAVGTYDAIGAGKINTLLLVEAMGDATYTQPVTSSSTEQTGNYAARLSDQLVENGYDDWFLPSRDGMVQMAEALYAGHNPLANFIEYPNYWSSNETGANSASYQRFIGDGIQGSIGKNTSYRIRPVRAF